MNHKKFRALLKKFRRKFKRQALAKLREQKAQNESSEDEIEESIKLEEEEKERERQHMLWLEREKEAQELFEKQKDLRELQKKKEEEIKKIKDDLVLSQKEKEIKIDEKKEQKLKLLESLNQETSNTPWHNPIAPEDYNVQTKESCSFFLKTGCCRFGERCSRSHPKPEISHTLLIKGMYSHFSIEQSNCDDYDADCNLEYEDSETYHHFCEFYDDVLPEFKKAGKVIQFKVCCNHEPHLRGNVYVQYSKQEEAEKAFRLFNTRWYGGKQLSCEFTNVIKWKSAICGLFHRNRCPKGSSCNFLHVFRNPDNEFWAADRDLEERRSGYRSERRNYRHRSPENRSDRRRRKKRRKRSASSHDRHLGSSPSDASSNSSRSPSPSRSRKRSSRRHSRKSSKSKKKRRH
ncbi:U2 small nuclear ribonucleoprotein auxiliary factor 35 kDa subunit-related protein 2-like [Centruroides vittatus]|uniref:U2 small nuclear ribonucleoprotein auxiliary factor 35 kDa subunit-related protein 2-like n=1 Tax=Centruroides vittatus TaxID=120091 RepID=UPI00350EC5A9